MRTIFDRLNDAYAKYYSPTAHLAIGEITVLFKGKVIFKQYIPKKHIWLGLKIYKLCDSKRYMHIQGYLGKGRICATATMTVTHATVSGLSTRTKNFGHKLYTNNFFCSYDSSDNLYMIAINCCGIARPNEKGTPMTSEGNSKTQ
jgi:hypothetical protein